MDKLTIAAQLYTLRDFLKTPDDIKQSFKKLKEIGYNSVQVSGVGPIDPQQLKDIADEAELEICATHVPYDRFKNDLDNLIKEHKIWDCKYIGLGALPGGNRSKEGYIKFAQEFSEIGKKVADKGLKFIYHNHKFEFEKYEGTTGMDILFSETDPEYFGFEIDTFWIQSGGANPVEWIYKVNGRMDVVHFKDMAIKEDQQIFAEIGEGNLNWDAIVKACRETGVKWYAIEQDKCLRDPFDSLTMSLKYLGKYL